MEGTKTGGEGGVNARVLNVAQSDDKLRTEIGIVGPLFPLNELVNLGVKR